MPLVPRNRLGTWHYSPPQAVSALRLLDDISELCATLSAWSHTGTSLVNSIDNQRVDGIVNHMTTDMKIRTERDHRYYANGYQNALQEILEIAAKEGSEAALQYARNNRDAR